MLKLSTVLIAVTSVYAVFIVTYYVSKYCKIKENKRYYRNMNIIKFLSIKPLKDYYHNQETLPERKRILIGFDNSKYSKNSYKYIIKVLNKESNQSKGVYFNISNNDKSYRLKKLLHIARTR